MQDIQLIIVHLYLIENIIKKGEIHMKEENQIDIKLKIQIFIKKMGIEGFSKFLEKYAPNSYFEVPLESFKELRIRVAIDMNNVAFQMMAIAIKDIVERTNLANEEPDKSVIENLALDKILYRLEIFMYYGITPVCVFDGKPHPLKSHGKTKRKANSEKVKQKLANAKNQLYSVDPLLRNQFLIDEYAKYLKQNIEVSWDFMDQLKNILDSVGFPVFSAADFNLETKDAEGICASLCLGGNNYCFATASSDSDYHTYGGNLEFVDIYSKRVNKEGQQVTMHFAKVRALESILQQTGLPFNSFRDLCIMMGTDYNDNIPGVGPVRCWNAIKQYGSIENMGVNVMNQLGYSGVLKVFNSTMVKLDIPTPDFDVGKFKRYARDTFNLHGLKDHTSTINDLLQMINVKEDTQISVEVPSNGTVLNL